MGNWARCRGGVRWRRWWSRSRFVFPRGPPSQSELERLEISGEGSCGYGSTGTKGTVSKKVGISIRTFSRLREYYKVRCDRHLNVTCVIQRSKSRFTPTLLTLSCEPTISTVFDRRPSHFVLPRPKHPTHLHHTKHDPFLASTGFKSRFAEEETSKDSVKSCPSTTRSNEVADHGRCLIRGPLYNLESIVSIISCRRSFQA